MLLCIVRPKPGNADATAVVAHDLIVTELLGAGSMGRADKEIRDNMNNSELISCIGLALVMQWSAQSVCNRAVAA